MEKQQPKRKLIIEALSFDYGRAFGFQEYLFNILNYFQNHRKEIYYDQIIIVCKQNDSKIFKKYIPEISVYSFKIKNPIHKYYVLNTLSWKLHLTSQDCIIFTNNYSSLIKRCKHILVIHDLLYLRPQYIPNLPFRIQRHLFIPRSISIADKIIGISQWVRKDIIEHFKLKNPEKVVAIYNYFDFNKYLIGSPSQSIINYCKSYKFFLIVSSNAKHKNLDKILDAFKLFCQKENSIRLLVVGKISGYVKEKYNTLPTDIQNRITNVYNISNADLGYLYTHTNAFISATLFEGLGMPIVEALYFNTPTLVSDIEVIKEVTAGKALYFPPNNVKFLSNLMLAQIQYIPNETSNIMKNMYSEKNTVAKYISLLNNI